jgi:hypothetical protein
LLDRVVLEPDSVTPERVQLWGVFALSPGQPGDHYRPAERGYMYYAINRRNDRATRAEWADLLSIAGTGAAVGFGSRYEKVGHVRRASEARSDPDTYPLGFGLVKLLSRYLGPQVQRELVNVPLPVSPADGARVRPGEVRLIVRNVADSTVRYVFELKGNGTPETSEPLPPGRAQTSWLPKMRVANGQTYTWRVWVTQGSWRGQPATSSFRAGQ